MGKKDKYYITLPNGSKAELHNGDKGFMIRHMTSIRVDEGLRYRFRPIRLTDKLEVGKRGMTSFPPSMEVSKHHVTVACMNNYYFIKDNNSKGGTYIRIGGSSKNKRIELHKGMTIAVGRIHLKVSSIEGDTAENRKARLEIAEAEKEKAAEAAEAAEKGAKKEEDLDSDEEYADDSDDEKKGGAKGGKKGKLDGPPVMFLSSLNKKERIKGRIRETSTIGADKEQNKIPIPEELAKTKHVSAIHTRIVLEKDSDGASHFYLEDAGGETYVGLPKKKFFEINGGDHLMFGMARAHVEVIPAACQVLDGIIDKILGDMGTNLHNMKIVGSASIADRIAAASTPQTPSKTK